VSDTPAPPAPRQRLGLFHDPLGDISSKRVESIAAFLEAALCPLWAPWLAKWAGMTQQLPIVPIMLALLSYSAALQGIAWGSESRMPGPSYSPPMTGGDGSAHI
jgi:hypothetical protein